MTPVIMERIGRKSELHVSAPMSYVVHDRGCSFRGRLLTQTFAKHTEQRFCTRACRAPYIDGTGIKVVDFQQEVACQSKR